MLRYVPSKHILMRVWLFYILFLHLWRYPRGFCLFFCWCSVPHWLISVCRIILVTVGWIQLDHGIGSFLCAVGFSLQIFCGGVSHLYCSEILVCKFLFCSVFAWFGVGWCWLHRMTLGVFPPLQSFGRVWDGLVWILLCMCGRIPQWSHLVLDFRLQEVVFGFVLFFN